MDGRKKEWDERLARMDTKNRLKRKWSELISLTETNEIAYNKKKKKKNFILYTFHK